jgi:hypothetical protein
MDAEKVSNPSARCNQARAFEPEDGADANIRRGAWCSNGPLLACALFAAHFSMLSFFWSDPPVWDNRWNYECILSAVDRPFDLLNFSVSGHICQGLFLYLGLKQASYDAGIV